MNANGTLLLADFGISFDVSVGDRFSGFVVTPLFASPEAFLGPHYYTQCDVS